MYCFIPAAGFGTRMKELTKSIPKPLLKIQNTSLLDINIAFGKYLGASQFIVNAHYLKEQIIEHVNLYKNLDITVSIEDKKILGTAGGIKTGISGKLKNENFLVINPDAIYFPEKDFFIQKDFSGEILLYLARSEENSGNTSLSLRNGKVYFEDGGLYYIGLCIIKPIVLDKVPMGEYFDLSDILKQYSQNHQLYGEIFKGTVVDLGDKEKFYSNQNLRLPDYV